MDLHVTFTAELLAEAKAAVAADLPDIETLRHLYRALARTVAGGRGRSVCTSCPRL